MYKNIIYYIVFVILYDITLSNLFENLTHICHESENIT